MMGITLLELGHRMASHPSGRKSLVGCWSIGKRGSLGGRAFSLTSGGSLSLPHSLVWTALQVAVMFCTAFSSPRDLRPGWLGCGMGKVLDSYKCEILLHQGWSNFVDNSFARWSQVPPWKVI